MEFRRYFPATAWLWSKRVPLVWTATAILVLSFIGYKFTEFAYLFRANQVMALISNSRSDVEVNAAISKLEGECRVDRTQSFGDYVARIHACSEGDFFHPYLRIEAADTYNSVTGERSLSADIVLPRYELYPIHLEINRLVSEAGRAVRVQRRPNSDLPKGIVLLAQAQSDFTVRVNYKCAIPFARCVYERDLVSITTR
jgi:hypothetical protein